MSASTTLWQAAGTLLDEWRSRLPADGGARLQNDDRYRAWADLVGTAIDYFDQPGPEFDNAALQQVLAWTGNGADIDAVDAVAWAIDTVGAPGFSSAWRDELCTSGQLRHRLDEGVFYPVADAAKELFAGVTLSSRPAALSPPARDELPHVRAHEDGGYEVFVDFSRESDLEKIGTDLKLMATLHPNQGNDEFDFQRRTPEILFPVRLKDEAEQERLVEALVGRALALEARIIVLPELASTEAIEARVRALLEDVESQHLVVVGSRHVGKDKSAQNVAFALTPESDEPIIHAKVVPFSNELRLESPWKEGINVPARPVLTIYPADRFRFCILICKDFLDKSVVAAVARLGVNVLCVPAMSEKTVSYPLRVGQLVADAQAIVVVANNPLKWDSALVDPIAVFGQPVAGREVVRAPAGQPVTAPALSLFHPGDNAATVVMV